MDRAVQKTDDDATASKYSATLKGYYNDEFIHYFHPRPPATRLPLINIGTYCRVYGVNKLVDEFLERTQSASSRAIVSLGAGSDTRAFQLLPQHANLSYFELDFPTKVAKKQQTIASTKQLHEITAAVRDRYHLVGADLRDLSTSPKLEAGPLSPLQQLRGQPTLLLSECCLCYLQPDVSSEILHFFAGLVPEPLLSVAIYEPISLNDEFGRVMTENLAMRGLSLPTIHRYPTLESQEQRLHTLLRVNTVGAVDIETVYTQWLTAQDRERLAKLEFLDEVEEMFLLMRHYCIAWGFST